MKNSTVVLEIFDFLKEQKLVEAENQFSEHWLGQSEAYLRRLRFTNKEPTDGVIAIIGSRLQLMGERLVNTPHSQVGQRFLELSKKCHALVNQKLTDGLMNKFN